MYKATEIIDSWRSLIAWRQNYDPNGGQLEEELTQGESGMYYQDEHPMITLQNLKSVMPDFSLVNYPAWLITTNYLKDQIVKDNGINYKALRDNVGKAPAANTDDWKVLNPFSEWIQQKTDAAIMDTVLAFLEAKEMNKAANTILENKTLFDGIGKLNNVVANADNRAGFEIVTSRSRGLNARLDRIGIQIDTIGAVTIYLHHSSKVEPLKTLILNVTKANSINWFDLAWDLPNISDDTDSGGAYYVTYKQSALPGQVIKKEKEWHEQPCASCATQTEINTWKVYSKFMEFHPFNVPEEAGLDLWDIEDNRYDYSSNQGLNFAISLYCDQTSFLVEQRDLFKSALRKQLAINLLRELAYNTNSRINQNESTVTRAQLLYEIDGSEKNPKTGINYKYTQAIEAVQLNTEGIHRVCLPCKRGNGVVYRTV